MGRIRDDMYDQYKIADPYFIKVTEDEIRDTSPALLIKVADHGSGQSVKSDTQSLIFQQAWDANVEIPPEMFDFINVMTTSARSGKYEPNNWLRKDGAINSDSRSMHASMFRHVAESQCGHRYDKETNLDPLLHLATRALMLYVRIKRGL